MCISFETEYGDVQVPNGPKLHFKLLFIVPCLNKNMATSSPLISLFYKVLIFYSVFYLCLIQVLFAGYTVYISLCRYHTILYNRQSKCPNGYGASCKCLTLNRSGAKAPSRLSWTLLEPITCHNVSYNLTALHSLL